jgi:hypothetical protein
MPSRPVAASSSGTRPDIVRDDGGDGTEGPVDPSKASSEAAAHTRFNAAQTPTVRTSPNPGTSQNAVDSTPSTAPKVLPA